MHSISSLISFSSAFRSSPSDHASSPSQPNRRSRANLDFTDERMVKLIAVYAAALQLLKTGAFLRDLSIGHLHRPSPFLSPLHAGSNDDRAAPRSDVYVYDGVFPPSACEELYYLASLRGDDGSSIFTRPPHNEKPLTPLEHAIDSALVELDDTSKLVEYWSRDEYMNIDAHVDIDEMQLEEERTLRCPKVAHVLYLQVQTGLRGPTCVFPDKKKGWGIDIDDDATGVDLVTVPAVQGRILRFPGSAMHAVPRPANRWLLSRVEERALRDQEEEEQFLNESSLEEEDDDDWDEDDDEDEDEDVERSVLLFNTWPDDEPPPRGVNGDYATGALPDGIELDEEDAADFSKTQEAQRLAEWEEEYGPNAQKIRCHARSEWQNVGIQIRAAEPESVKDELRICLMGKKKRRVYFKKIARLAGPASALQMALMKEKEVSLFRLEDTID
jgi:hypothetical protein